MGTLSEGGLECLPARIPEHKSARKALADGPYSKPHIGRREAEIPRKFGCCSPQHKVGESTISVPERTYSSDQSDRR